MADAIRHPHPEVLGAFLEGRATAAERAEVVEHLAVCDVCIGHVRETREATRESSVTPFVPPSRFRRPWHLVAAAAVIAVLALVARNRFVGPGAAADVDALIAAAPASYRTVEPRLTGFRWAALQHVRGAESPQSDPERLKLGGVAGEVLADARGRDTADARRAAGVASLLVNDSARAVEELQRATRQDPEDAESWNDLAAALYTSAVRQRRASDLSRALAATDRALRLRPEFAEARFNRALVLDRMGLQNEAVAAWRAYLELDADSQWAAEARRHLQQWPAAPQSRFRDRVPALEAAAAAGDRARVDAVLREFPQEVRGWFEADVLGRWGEAELAGDAAAAPLLAGARTVAAALRARSGESLLADALHAIDAAESRTALARAHAAYRAGRLAYRDRKLADAERLLLGATAAFDRAGSPMAGVARVYAASTMFDDNRIDEAAALAGPLVAAPGGHIALRAQAAALHGRCDMYAQQWSDALRNHAIAVEAYRRLNEPANLGDAQNALAGLYANAGELEQGWQHRLDAFRILGAGDSGVRLLRALAAAAWSELRHERWDSAEALLRLEIAEAQRVGDPLLVADAFRRRAMLHAQRGAQDAAASDLREARGYAARAQHSGLSERFSAECALVEGVALRADDPAGSVASLSAAVAFARRSGNRMLLPEALLERARTLRSSGRLDEAWRDLAAGIEEVEDRRRTADGGMGATLDAAAALFDEAIDLLLERGDEERAFAYAERAHARALLDAIDAKHPVAGRGELTAGAIREALSPGEALVTYALLPERIAIFHVTREELRVFRPPVRRAGVEADVRALRMQLDERAPVATLRATSARLDAALVAPLRPFGRVGSLVIVGDRVLQSLPWAALWDGERGAYLIEHCALAVAPSAGVWLRSERRLAAARAGDRLLLVTSDARADLDPLGSLRREADALRSAYPHHARLTDAEATPSRFLEDAGAADVVHYAGHARAATDTAEAALLLGDAGELTASRIARARLVRPRLVVLAACGTMAGQTGGLEGAPGLARAFLAAGVPTVVGTLWPVRDSDAAALFVAFHERLRSGSPPPAALRDAQLAMLRGPAEAAHPAAWASAQVLGGSS
jgi:CHAT domain-containing protein